MQPGHFPDPLERLAFSEGFFSPGERWHEVPLEVRRDGPVVLAANARPLRLNYHLIPIVNPWAQLLCVHLLEQLIVRVAHWHKLDV